MAVEEQSKERFLTLAKGAYLDVLLPRSSDFDAESVLRKGSADDLGRVPVRRNLYFDEKATIQLLLKTPAGRDQVQDLLPNLELVLAAHATDAVPQGKGSNVSPSAKHDLTSVTLAGSKASDALIVADYTYVVWNLELHIPWPRTRLQRPAIYFTATLTLSSTALESTPKESVNAFLPPYEPLSANVLEPLNSDPSLQGREIFLPEDRITKVAPKPPKKDESLRPIRGATKRAFPVMPALFTRISYAAVPDGIVATLAIETSHIVAGKFHLSEVDMTARLNDSSVETDKIIPENLTALEWPVMMYPDEELSLLYRIAPQDGRELSAKAISLTVNLHATLALENGSTVNLDMVWHPEKHSLPAAQEPHYKWSPPSHQSTPSTESSVEPSSSERTPAKSSSSVASDHGLTFLFTAPSTVKQRRDMQIKVQCTNNSRTSRNLAVMHDISNRQQRLHSSDNSKSHAGVTSDYGDPVPNSKARSNVFCNSPDVRTGLLAPGATFETEMEIFVKDLGLLDLGSIRILNLDTKQTVDVRELPDIISVEASADDPPFEPRGSVPRRDDATGRQIASETERWRQETEQWMAHRGKSSTVE
ncbi:hypothetical protein D0867_08949 [Hortaea werneckii]|uniref:Trafficking protein particle complex II-specific subunit 65 IgD3 domain-containing protein n=1 Tax=Hortaea werneckii TaxID=91943 RepID=A0A3M6Z108_HORWE|nr:hypothetical protein KC334_g4789 [Hortaea werneckii]KAI7012706.1 hypothetical protein KC355_g5326 [Hortaea werneckii]RMY08711.1 hypothetical protein D0867_08949 [Hortaea werneckii]RMY27096.1 hypothetical protein D0866_10385 [Hortaea werneckii]